MYDGDSVGFLDGLTVGEDVVGESVGISEGVSVGEVVVGSGVGFVIDGKMVICNGYTIR